MSQEKQFKKVSLQYEMYESEDHKLLVQGKSFSEIPVMSTEGIHDVYLFDGNVNGERFQEFTTNSLPPILNPFNWSNSHSVVIMDNVSIHHVHGVVDSIESQGARLIFFTLLTRS